MTDIDCRRESDVVDAVASGRWPLRVDAELASHVGGCAVCRDVALVATTIAAGHDAAWPDARVPSSAHVWWRAQMRARREAAIAAQRPITLVQGLAAAAAAGLAAAALRFAASTSWWPRLAELTEWTGWSGVMADSAAATGRAAAVVELLRQSVSGIAASAAAFPHIEAVLVAGALLLLMPAALLFVSSEK